MKNPTLALKKLSAARFHAVVLGDTYLGPKRGYLLLPGQPRKGLSHAAAVKLALTYAPADIIAFAGARTGSYANSRFTFEPVSKAAHGGERGERLTANVARPTPVAAVDHTQQAASLIERRRAALRELAVIDAELSQLESVPYQAIQLGMARPLATTLRS